MLTDTIIEDDRWEAAGLGALAEEAAQATLALLGLVADDYEIAVMGCSDGRIAILNADFRGRPAPTNVLSWPTQELGSPEVGGEPFLPHLDDDFEEMGEPHHLGDLALAWETCEREAAEQGKSMADHVTHLLVHGVLHLVGYDHIRDADATLMEGLEREILGNLGIADPYREINGPNGS
ncbi:MAG: rRNA maturation RNase YbeY [Sagittula sp.]|jgi:probable rRNA maturation factor|uniref:rRNA maturation RNase YbeY n=1 Tax=unclassified Sagittula TaxID=2624628 RepID=UPI000C2D449A|nr:MULTISPECIES: rRNA maturation RNase YbeY [unclassified Sagittula]AUC52971.1 rRNA maturation RNase YbeY [Sagittula sp. P11]WHZ35702.1 rRNA maturation RNase YbeY [Sagittula sp. MA-2]